MLSSASGWIDSVRPSTRTRSSRVPLGGVEGRVRAQGEAHFILPNTKSPLPERTREASPVEGRTILMHTGSARASGGGSAVHQLRRGGELEFVVAAVAGGEASVVELAFDRVSFRGQHLVDAGAG